MKKQDNFQLSEEQQQKQQSLEEKYEQRAIELDSRIRPLIYSCIVAHPVYQACAYQPAVLKAALNYTAQRYRKYYDAYNTLAPDELKAALEKRISSFFEAEMHLLTLKRAEEAQQKLDKLEQACWEYQSHLATAIANLAYTLPKPAYALYCDEQQQFDVEKICEKAKSGGTLLGWELSQQTDLHTTETHPNLHKAIKKYNTVKTLQALLTTAGQTPLEQLDKFEATFHQPAIQATLKANRDSKGLQFIKNVGHILTLGLVSYWQKKTFAFWKPHGEVVTQHIEKTLILTNMAPGLKPVG